MRRRRAAVMAVLIALSGCQGQSHPIASPRPPRSMTLRRATRRPTPLPDVATAGWVLTDGIRHPTTWRAQPFPFAGSFSFSITDLSTEMLHSDPIENLTPVHLRPNGVVIVWSGIGSSTQGHPLPAPSPGQLLVDGYPAALVDVAANPLCRARNGDRTVTGSIDMGDGRAVLLHACIDSGGTKTTEAQVETMFRLARFR